MVIVEDTVSEKVLIVVVLDAEVEVGVVEVVTVVVLTVVVLLSDRVDQVEVSVVVELKTQMLHDVSHWW